MPGLAEPISTSSRSQVHLCDNIVTRGIDLPEGVQAAAPGDRARMTVTLTRPVALEEGLRFAITEDGEAIGWGAVSSSFAR
ncbi:hypothetical protein [Streptomyces sp. NPDC060035]|uniref:EF-Tu C-terminal domain-related protein n=1 Tax=Streptomyces sp. NPDC060035 TaxID=3347044 RepID=UPI0036C5FCF2